MRPMHASFAALALMSVAAAGPGTIVAAPEEVTIDLPKSAQGNGSRGHPNNKGGYITADQKKRRRKLAQASRRRNR